MKRQDKLVLVASVVVIIAFMAMGVSSAFADQFNDPNFTSYGNTTFDDGTGYGWWGLAQYDGRATVNIGASSNNRIISMQSGMTVDKYDTSMFSFNVSIQMLDGATPTGRLNFQRYSSNGGNSLSAQVQDTLQDVYLGWDEVNQAPIYTSQMQARFHADLFANAEINSIIDSFDHWTSGYYDSNGDMYFSQTGGQFNVNGNGRFIGEDPAAFGKMMVDSGMASYGNVPEPATMVLLAIGGMLGMTRRRRQR